MSHGPTTAAPAAERRSPRELAGAAAGMLWAALMRVFEPPMAALQRLVGIGRMPYLFLLPNLAFFGVFVIAPLFINIGYSFTGGTDLYLTGRPFVGAEQYGHLFNCESFLNAATCREDRFWRGVYNTFTFVTFQVAFMVLFALVTALVLNQEIRARGFFRAVFFFPVLLSPVVVALIWKWILLRDGLLNAALMGMGFERVLWLAEADWAMAWSIFVSVWAHMGFYTLILLAGLQAIPPDLYEAAEMDGTSRWRAFWRITLPLLWPNLLVVLVLALIRAVQVFDEVYVLTGGGPGTATQFLVQYIYNTGFANRIQNFGLASAASVVLGVVLFALTITQLALARRRDGAT